MSSSLATASLQQPRVVSGWRQHAAVWIATHRRSPRTLPPQMAQCDAVEKGYSTRAERRTCG